MAKKQLHPESQLQIQCVAWLKYQYPYLAPLFFAVPNGGSRDKREAAIMKAEGITAGVSDLILNVPSGRYTQLAIEMKAGSSQSEAQKRYQRYAEAVGIKYIVCKSFQSFQGETENYIENIRPDIIEALKKLRADDLQAEKEEARRLYQKRCCNTKETKTA